MSKAQRNDRYAIIMAGGRGERFWPLSRQKTPKQLLTLVGNRSFLQQAVDHVLPIVPLDHVFVITNAVQVSEVRRQLPGVPKANVVAEPCGRDTCAAVTLGAALVGARSSTGVMAVLPADHVIPEPKKFAQVLRDSFDLASQDQVLVTIGIKPAEPATGYGYIHVGDRLSAMAKARPYKTAFFKAQKFVEKPPYEKAVEYVNSGEYRWNAGMFIWSVDSITGSLAQHQPEMAEACHRWLECAGTPKLSRLLAKEYPTIRKLSIDYALMEKARNVVVADGSFAWDDVGSWTSLAHHLKPDAAGNCAVGEMVEVDAAGNIVFDARTRKKTPIALVGVSDCIVVQTDDATLVAHKTQAQKVKELVVKLAQTPKYRALL